MGGPRQRKPTLEDYPAFDVFELRRAGWFGECLSGGEVELFGQTLTLRGSRDLFSIEVAGDKQLMPVHWTQSPAGERPRLECVCGRTVYKLRWFGTMARCRHCLGSMYRSQQCSKVDNSFNQLRKIKQKLGDHESEFTHIPKPKGMHWSRYDRYMQRAVTHGDKIMQAAAATGWPAADFEVVPWVPQDLVNRYNDNRYYRREQQRKANRG